MAIMENHFCSEYPLRNKRGDFLNVSQSARIKEIRKALGLSLEKFSELFDDPPITRAGVGHWEHGGGISDKHLSQLVAKTGYRRSWITDGELPKKTVKERLQPDATVSNVQHPTGRRDLPILGAARGGLEGVFLDNGSHFGMVERPPQLDGVNGAYAVHMVGDSMEPRYSAGETLLINPHKPLRQGNYVVIQLAPEEEGGDMLFFVKRYVRQTQRDLVCEQLNPAQEVRYPAARTTVHRVVGLWEE